MTTTSATQPIDKRSIRGRLARLSRLNGMRMIWGLILLMAAVALALHTTDELQRPALAGPFHIWWPLLALGFAASEVWVVHVHFRRDAHSFSMSEVPLVLGLF